MGSEGGEGCSIGRVWNGMGVECEMYMKGGIRDELFVAPCGLVDGRDTIVF